MEQGGNPDDSTTPKLAMAGASGFVGQALADKLSERYQIVALTRSAARSMEPDANPRLQWRHCDLFSVNRIIRAIHGCKVAVYLVHSMMPSSRLTQANFVDLDLLLADNFARACEACGVEQILYVGGLMPRSGKLSDHLASRLEVETTLASRNVPVTALRAGLVVGPGGSSTRILVNLVKRLPMMGLPRWCESHTHPIALRDLVRAVDICVGNEETFDRQFDIGGADVLTYREMLSTTADVLGLSRPMFRLPMVPSWLSLYWVKYFSGAPLALVGPLVESLKHNMVASENPLQKKLGEGALDFRTALTGSLNEKGNDLAPNPRKKIRQQDDHDLRRARHVRSVQRMTLPPGRDARWVAQEYMRWLPRYVWPLLHCRVENRIVQFRVKMLGLKLLELTLAPDWSGSDRQVFFITGGVLADSRHNKRGRFEFREALGGSTLIAAIHDYTPRLPWYVYIWTQAVAHLWVMNAFGHYLAKLARRGQAERPRLPGAPLNVSMEVAGADGPRARKAG